MLSTLQYLFFLSLVAGSVFSFEKSIQFEAWNPAEPTTPKLFTACFVGKVADLTLTIGSAVLTMKEATTKNVDDGACYALTSCDIWEELAKLPGDKGKELKKDLTTAKLTTSASITGEMLFRINSVHVKIPAANESVTVNETPSFNMLHLDGYHGCKTSAKVDGMESVFRTVVLNEKKDYPQCITAELYNKFSEEKMKDKDGNDYKDYGEILFRSLTPDGTAKNIKDKNKLTEEITCSGAASVFVASFAILASLLSITGILKQ